LKQWRRFSRSLACTRPSTFSEAGSAEAALAVVASNDQGLDLAHLRQAARSTSETVRMQRH
jgi:hypothetical protein